MSCTGQTETPAQQSTRRNKNKIVLKTETINREHSNIQTLVRTHCAVVCLCVRIPFKAIEFTKLGQVGCVMCIPDRIF